MREKLTGGPDREKLRRQGLKRCDKCHRIQKKIAFYADKRTWDLQTRICRECHDSYQKEYKLSGVRGSYSEKLITKGRVLRAQGLKRCCTCKENKPLSAFNKEAAKWDGLSGACRHCDARKSKIRRAEIAADPVLLKKKQKKTRLWNRKNRRLHMLYNTRSGAKKKGLEHDLTISDIVVPELCPVLGIPLRWGNTGFQPNAPSVDRLDNTKGYVRGNINIISYRANSLKSDATLEELEAVVRWLKLKQVETSYDREPREEISTERGAG